MVTSDPVELLCKLLESTFDKRYQLATQYIKAFNLDSTMVSLVMLFKSCSSDGDGIDCGEWFCDGCD